MDLSGKQLLDFDQIVIRNPDRARYLLNVPAISEVPSIDQMQGAIAQAMADILMAVMGFCYPPIGGIMAWHKDLTPNIAPLPANWVECNGSVLNDPESPLHGVTLPDLNGGNRFLRGNATSGGTGGADTHVHSVATATAGPSATVNAPTGIGQTVPSASHTHNTNFNTGSADGKPPYLNVVWIIRIK